MNKTTLLTAGIIVSVVAALAYSLLGEDKGSTNSHQQVKSESVQAKAQSTSPTNSTKVVTVTSDKNSKEKAIVVDENSYVRSAPPPPSNSPVNSNKAKDGRHTSPKAHGHEETASNQKRNAPPPPTGAN